MGRTLQLLVGIAAAIAAIVAVAGGAAADAAEPTNFRSTVTSIEVPGVEAEIIGGDAFIRMSVPLGTELFVLGYSEEPYLRFSADGTVERNLRSPATYTNEDRFADVAIPATADPEAEPEWEVVARDGAYTWHDHRTHWMIPELPANVVDRGETVLIDTWEVPLQLAGSEQTLAITGDLQWEPDTSLLPAIALGVLLTAAIGWVLATRPEFVVLVALGVAAVALVAGWVAWSAQPDEGRGVGPEQVLPVISCVAALVAAGTKGTVRAGAVAVVAIVGAGWALGRLDVLARPLVPSGAPLLDRVATVAQLGFAAAVVVALVAVVVRPELARRPGGTAPTAPEPSAG